MLRNLKLSGCVALTAAMLVALSAPSRAQFGNLFGETPPRPPGSVPRGAPPPAYEDDEEVPELPQGRLLPTPIRPQPGQGVPPPGAFQTQPLAPPPGAVVTPRVQPGAPPPAAATTPGVAAPSVAATPPAADGVPAKIAPPAPATLQPGDEVVTEAPAQKIVNKKAVFSGLDKITGRITKFDVDIGEIVQFGALRVKTDACYTRPATEAANTDAFVEVDEITLQGEVKRIFSGWMFAASPGLHGVEHPIYDIWLTDCKEPDTTVAASQPEPPKPAPPAAVQKRTAKPPARPTTPPAPSSGQLPAYR